VKAEAWRKSSAAPERDVVAGAATDLLLRVAEHLELEELKVLPLIDRYLTEKEWQEVGGSGLKAMSFRQLTVAFGMILDHARPEQVKIMRDTLPRVPWTIFSLVGPRAYLRYARRLRRADAVVHTTAA
jgi:hypothetical protein